jgi:hypothetical protein
LGRSARACSDSRCSGPQPDARDPPAQRHHQPHGAQGQQAERDQEGAHRVVERRRVDAHDQPHGRPVGECCEAHRQRAVGAAAAGQRQAAVAGLALVDALHLVQALAVEEARVVAEHPEAHAAVGGRQRVHLHLQAGPVLEVAEALDRVAHVLQVGVQVVVLVARQLALEHAVQRGAHQREHGQRGQREHPHEARRDGPLHACRLLVDGASSRASIT